MIGQLELVTISQLEWCEANLLAIRLAIHDVHFEHLQKRRESSLLTTYWSESIQSSR